MAGKNVQYDESGSTFSYFVLSFLGLILVPVSYYSFFKKEDKFIKEERQCQCEMCRYKRLRLQKPDRWKTFKTLCIRAIILLGWMLFAYVAYQITQQNDSELAIRNPYEILQVKEGDSDAAIKKAYRKLTLIHHPDKETGDEMEFMRITEAYRILMDETARRNWEEYGHPDGPRVASFGIALPSWIVDKNNSFLVLGVYAVVFLAILPIAVSVWWYRSMRYSRDEVLLDTTKIFQMLFYRSADMPIKRIIRVFGYAAEFDPKRNSEIRVRDVDSIEMPKLIREFPDLEATLPRKSAKAKRQRRIQPPYSIKAQALLYAHIYRFKLTPALDEDRLCVVGKSPVLIPEMISCLSYLMAQFSGRKWKLATLENCMKLSALTVQALGEFQSPFLQLPHMSEERIKQFVTKRRQVRSLQQLAGMSESDRRSLLEYLTDEQYQNVMTVLGSMPHVEMSFKVKVVDDESEEVYTSNVVTVSVTLFRENLEVRFGKPIEAVAEVDDQKVEESSEKKSRPWQKNMKKRGAKKKTVKKGSQRATSQLAKSDEAAAEKASEILDENDESERSDSESGSQESESDDDMIKFAEEYQQHRRKALENTSRISHPVHCPFFPTEKQEYWWLYIYDKVQKRIQSQMAFLTHLVDREEVTLKFMAPPKPGQYSLYIALRSDSYVGFDQVKEFKILVKKAPKKEMEKTEAIEDEEETDDLGSDVVTDDDEDEDTPTRKM